MTSNLPAFFSKFEVPVFHQVFYKGGQVYSDIRTVFHLATLKSCKPFWLGRCLSKPHLWVSSHSYKPEICSCLQHSLGFRASSISVRSLEEFWASLLLTCLCGNSKNFSDEKLEPCLCLSLYSCVSVCMHVLGKCR